MHFSKEYPTPHTFLSQGHMTDPHLFPEQSTEHLAHDPPTFVPEHMAQTAEL